MYVLLWAEAAAISAILHLLLRQDGIVVRSLDLIVVVLLDYDVEGVQVWVALAHGLTRARRHDSSTHISFLNSGQRIVILRHILLLADQAIQTLNVLWTQLVVLQIAGLLPCSTASHVFELNVIGVEVLNDADVVGLGVLPVHHVRHASFIVGGGWHLRAVEATGSCLLINNVLHIGCI